MRHFGLPLCVLALASSVHAQTCESSVFARNGAVIETTEYNDKDQVSGVQVYTVANIAKTAAGVQSAPRSIKKDKGGKVTEQKVFHYACNVQGVRWGMGFQDTKTHQEATLVYPTDMRPGQNLNTQIEGEYTGKTPEGKNAEVGVKINNRKVVGTEKISLKAGAWTCTKITYDFLFRLKVGFVGLPLNFTVTEWYSPEVGVVRSETRMKGTLFSHSEITAVKR
jgi:hypothetical protein